MPIAAKPPKRRRGGQQGNHNARTHGFYSASLTPDEIGSIWTLITRDHVAPDTAIMRVKIMSLLHQAPADRRVLRAVVRIIMQWSSSKYNFNRKQNAVLKAALAEVVELRFCIPVATPAQKALLLKYDIVISVQPVAAAGILPQKSAELIPIRFESPNAPNYEKLKNDFSLALDSNPTIARPENESRTVQNNPASSEPPLSASAQALLDKLVSDAVDQFAAEETD
jgi:hypothetical protein